MIATLLFVWHLVWGSYIGRMLTAAVVALALLKGYGLQQQYVGKQELRQESIAVGKKNNEQAKKNVDKLSNDKYFDRMFKSYCRDCK